MGLDVDFLSRALTSAEPLTHLSEEYVYDLTGASLQSAQQLYEACGALGLDPKKDVRLSKPNLAGIFEARNQIVHEMDIDFSAARRNRFQRSIEGSVRMANELLHVAQRIVELTYAKLTDST